MAGTSTRITRLRPFTNHLVNPLTRRVAGWLPGFAILHNVGRRSGRAYETPINVFKRGDRYLFALTYGTEVQWLRNILAAGRCTMEHRSRRIELIDPEVVHDPSLHLMPPPVRLLGRLNDVTDILVMRPADR